VHAIGVRGVEPEPGEAIAAIVAGDARFFVRTAR